MSLIQDALEKASQSRNAPKPFQAARIRPDDVFGDGLEKELREVQRYHKTRRLFGWKIAAGVILLALVVSWPIFRWGHSTILSKDPAQTIVMTATIPKVSPSPFFSSVAYRLSGITNLGDKPRAVINGQIVAVGDTVSKKAVVKEIQSDGVLLEVHGKDFQLTM